MRMTVKLNPKNKLSSILNNDEEDDEECEIDAGKELKQLDLN